ncbi:MAG: peptidylprolyl isomerase, partial [Flavobacterium sp.]|nr:peptidylprolyl isomerase [Flavobacterium sp.]
DGVLTKDEGGADGDPTNDFNDPNNPTLPDYLNPDVTSN